MTYLAATIHQGNVEAIELGLESPFVVTWKVDQDGNILGVTSTRDSLRAAALARLIFEVQSTT